MLRLVDPESELTLDLDLPSHLQEAFRVQLGRHWDCPSQSRFVIDMSAWLALAIFQSADRDLWPPTYKQLRYADVIATRLGIDIPDEAYMFRGTMSDFIRHFAPMLDTQIG